MGVNPQWACADYVVISGNPVFRNTETQRCVGTQSYGVILQHRLVTTTPGTESSLNGRDTGQTARSTLRRCS